MIAFSGMRRFVATRSLELATLMLDLAEWARVLDGQRGLGRKSLQQLSNLTREFASDVTGDDKTANDVLFAEKRQRKHRPASPLW
jgi:hypothetical protein